MKHGPLGGRREAFIKEKLSSHGEALLEDIRRAPCSLLGLFPTCLRCAAAQSTGTYISLYINISGVV